MIPFGEFERIWGKRSWRISRYYRFIRMDGLRKITSNFILCPDSRFEVAPPENNSKASINSAVTFFLQTYYCYYITACFEFIMTLNNTESPSSPNFFDELTTFRFSGRAQQNTFGHMCTCSHHVGAGTRVICTCLKDMPITLTFMVEHC